jgi:haloalkane dehalogenase
MKMIMLMLMTMMFNAAVAQSPAATPTPPIQMVKVRGIQMAYRAVGKGIPVVFLHGIPTSSFLWREILPVVGAQYRAIAPDLAGYGQSDLPPNGDYSFQAQYQYLEGFMQEMGLENAVLVVNDLGSALGIKYATDHPEKVKGLIMLEAAYMPAQEWYNQLTFMQRSMFSIFGKKQKMAEKMIVTRNKMPKMVMKMGTKRKLKATEMEAYLAPYRESTERRKVYFKGPGPATFPAKGRSLTNGDFADVLDQNAKGLLRFPKPMLLLYATPGLIVRKPAIAYAKAHFPNCKLVHIGKGKHFLPEDQPQQIQQAILEFLSQIQ